MILTLRIAALLVFGGFGVGFMCGLALGLMRGESNRTNKQFVTSADYVSLVNEYQKENAALKSILRGER